MREKETNTGCTVATVGNTGSKSRREGPDGNLLRGSLLKKDALITQGGFWENSRPGCHHIFMEQVEIYQDLLTPLKQLIVLLKYRLLKLISGLCWRNAAQVLLFLNREHRGRRDRENRSLLQFCCPSPLVRGDVVRTATPGSLSVACASTGGNPSAVRV